MKISDLKTEIGHFKTLNMVLLAIVTAGGYFILWLTERYKIFNRIAGKEIVSRNFIIWVAALMGLSIYLDIAATEAEGLQALSSLVDLAWGIMLIVMSFKTAEAMELYFAKNFQAQVKFNKFYLIIFNIYYINYMINALDDIERKHEMLTGNKPTEPTKTDAAGTATSDVTGASKSEEGSE